MPTVKPRHVITETAEVAAALDAGQRRWPGLSRGKVASRLVEEAGRRLSEETNRERRARRDALRAPPPGVHAWHPPGYLDELRRDWDE